MISNTSNRSYECNAHNKVHFQPNITDIHPRELYHSHDFQQVLHACHVFQLHFMAGTRYSFSWVCTWLPAATAGHLVSIKLSRRKSELYHSHLWHVVVRVSLGWILGCHHEPVLMRLRRVSSSNTSSVHTLRYLINMGTLLALIKITFFPT